ncbi:Adenylate cyclase [Methylophaga frappieri]|uniref:Adenylate cyclase n=1 Tax=Methylophaga frappieri (strain ATCC BAA-2434 / DSM 25690 / JAM7) TaxID=754477 RepID=I1YLD6_METFJ|nr:tetratricopeptide repeat protein [Methylophaga frappieri]AFJ03729.1 Adenylate cyclase [Methylophaga frappieri]
MVVLEEIDKDRVREHAEKILASRYFSNSTRQQRFLKYLVSQSLSDDAPSLKGYTIGIEVFDREPDFDPGVDSIVRVEATRIRNKLREYYEKEGAQDEVRIHFRKGTYKLEFTIGSQTPERVTPEENTEPETISSKPSLVVLPFVSIGPDNSRDYFADGITDSLISLLARLSGLFVISRQSAFTYKDTLKTSNEIATELGVQYLLEGSLQHAGDRVRIAARLVNADNSSHIWSERYDCDLTDIFALQDEITKQIVDALKVQLTRKEDKLFGVKATNNIDAHDMLLRAVAIYYKYSKESTEQSIELLQQVIELDENYVAGHAWLARALSFMWSMHWCRERSILNRAIDSASKALELDPQSPYANSVMGWVLMWRLDEASSISYCKKAVSLDPNNAEALLFLSMTLSSAGLGEDALESAKKAMRFTPTSAPFYQYALGNAYYVLKEYKKSLDAYEHGIKLNTNFLPNHYGQLCAFERLGRQEEITKKLVAYEQLRNLIELADNPIWTSDEILTEVKQIRKKLFAEK